VENADRRFLGALLPAQALGNSRNVPAAALVRADGVADSLLFLDGLGLGRADDPGTEYGLTLAIGAMPTTLARLVAAYGALANDGAFSPLRWYREQDVAPARRVMDDAVSGGPDGQAAELCADGIDGVFVSGGGEDGDEPGVPGCVGGGVHG
jgi:penicillin-binding protein 1C